MSHKIIVTLCCAFLVGVAHIALAAASDRVVMTPSDPKLVSPRAFPSVAFTIQNTGTTTDTFDLSLELPLEWSSISSLESLTLEPGQTRKKIITVSVPATAAAHTTYSIILSAISTSDANTHASATALIEVKSVLGLKLTPEPYPELAWAAETVHYNFEIQNLGNSTDVFEIETHSDLDWTLNVSQARMSLEPYQKAVIQVVLQVPEDIVQEQLYLFSFRVFSGAAQELDQDISDEVKIRLRTIPGVEQQGKTYQELPGVLELESPNMLGADPNTPEITLRFDTGGNLTDAYHAGLHFDGVFFGEKDAVEIGSYWFMIGREENWDIILGRTNTSFTRLTEDLHGAGISMRTFGKRFDTRAFAGYRDEEEDRKEFSAGANMTARVNPKSAIGFTSIFVNDEGYSQNTQLYSLFGEYQPFEPLTLSGELAYGITHTDIAENGGPAWLTTADIAWERLGIRGEYYRAETAYPGNVTDKEGFSVYSRYSLFRPLSVWLKYDRYHNNPEHEPTYLTTATEKMSAGVHANYGNWPTLDVTWTQHAEKNNEFTPPAVQNSLEKSLSLNLYKSFDALTLSAGGKWGATRDRLTGSAVNIAEYSAAVNGRLNMLTWRVSYQRDKNLQEYVSEPERTEQIEFELGCRLFDMVNANIGYTNEVRKTPGNTTRKQTYDVDVDLSQAINIGRQHSLGFNVEMDNLTDAENREWRVGLMWKMMFATPVPWMKTKGRVQGQIFLDEDGNGSQGTEETVYPKIRLTLNGMTVYTNPNGMFEFPVLEPGEYQLDVNLSQLPSGIIPAIPLPRHISLKQGDEIFIDIPLEYIGLIQGRVFDDANTDEHDNDDEDGLSPIRIILLQNGNVRHEAFTDQDGRYLITDIQPGDYVVTLDQEYLPSQYVLTTPNSFEVTVRSKEQITGIDFGAYRKPKKIIKTFFKKKE